VRSLNWSQPNLDTYFTYDCYLKNVVRTPPGWEQLLFGTDFELLPEISCSATWNQQSERILPIYRDSATLPKIWWTLVQKRLRMSFCPPPKFSHWETLPALPHGRYTTDSRQTLARVCRLTNYPTVSNSCICHSLSSLRFTGVLYAGNVSGIKLFIKWTACYTKEQKPGRPTSEKHRIYQVKSGFPVC